MEESQAGYFEPGAVFQFGFMDEIKGRGQLPAEAAGDVVENYGAMEDPITNTTGASVSW